MKLFFLVLGLSALLAGCVAVPYDADTVYYPAPTVSATISSGHYHPYPGNYPYYRPAPYYQHYQRPAYVTPAPVIVPPPVYFNYNRNARPGMHQHPHPRHDGTHVGHHRRDDARPDGQRRDGGRNEWRRNGPAGNTGGRFHSQ